MSRKGKKDDVDLLEGFSLDSVLSGEVRDQEAFVPDSQMRSEIAIEAQPKQQDIPKKSIAKPLQPRSSETKSPISTRETRGNASSVLNKRVEKQPENCSRTRVQEAPRLHKPAGSDLDSNKTADRQPLDSINDINKTAIKQPLDSTGANARNPLDSHKAPDWTAGKTANRQPLDSSKTAKWSFDRLSGKEAELIQMIFHRCKNSGSLQTEKMSTDFLRDRLKVSTKRVRNLVERLEEKLLLTVIDSKRGNGAFRQFALPASVYHSMILSSLDSNKTADRQLLDSHKAPDWTADKTATPPSSSRDLLMKESTTTQPVADLSTIDLSRIQHLGITTSVLARCVELYPILQPEQLEGLVFRFAEFVKDPKNKVQNARGFFISLAEQASKGQVPLDHIETPDERLMRLFVEQQEAAKSRRAELERKAQEFECETWLELLTAESKLQLVPETAILKAGTAAHVAMLKSYFVENVWPERRRQILESATASP